MKKFLLITIPIVVILGFAGWYFFFNKSVTLPVTTSTGSPFGTAPSNTSGSSGTSNNPVPVTTGANASITPPTLFRVASDPVAGGVIYINKSKQELIRYVDRATGHIYEVDPLNLVKTELVDNTVPKVYEADWKPDGTTLITRTLASDEDAIQNTSLTLIPPKPPTGTTTPQVDTLYTATATQLRGNLSALTITPTGLAYLLKDTGTIGTSGFAGEKPLTAYISPFNEWRITSAGASTLAITTNASSKADGFAYLLNTKSQGLTKILGPLPALTTLVSPDGTRVIYSYLDGNNTNFSAENIKSKTVSSILPATLPEKCVWSLKSKNIIFCGTPVGGITGNQPDSWYQGSTHFSDQIWKFDTTSGIATLLAEPTRSFKVNLDVTKPSLSPNEDYLLFINHTDLSLWALKL